jgi:short-subunit dehydrogenase
MILLARRQGPLDALAEELVTTFGIEVRTAPIDLTGNSLLDDLGSHIDGIEVGLLVYNAGASPHVATFLDRSVEDAIYMVNINCRGPVLLAHHLGSSMAARRRGGMIFMTSTSAMAGGAYIAAYCASKSFELVLGEALWIELGQSNVDVLVAMAGLTDTPAMHATGPILEGTSYRVMSPVEVVDEALEALGNGNPLVPVGPDNRAAIQGAWPVPRADLVLGMTAGCASMYGLPIPLRPGATGEK